MSRRKARVRQDPTMAALRTDGGRFYLQLARVCYADADRFPAGPERRDALRQAAHAMRAMREAEARCAVQ